MNVVDVVQGSPEWLAARLGMATASRVAEIPARTKSGGYRTSRANYLAELVAERLTGKPTDSYRSADMLWGTEHEPAARREYAFLQDVEIQLAGFVKHPKIKNFGASPDGLVTTRDGEIGLVEIKCPLTATHITTLRTGEIDAAYYLQAQAQMSCTELSWCDFVSYDPRLPEAMQLFVKRLARNDETIDMIEAEVELFLNDLELTLDELKLKFHVEEVVT